MIQNYLRKTFALSHHYDTHSNEDYYHFKLFLIVFGSLFLYSSRVKINTVINEI
jgi:hypothetical protein